MVVAIQMRSEEEREKTWHVIKTANDWGKGRKDLSGGRMAGKGLMEIICQTKIRVLTLVLYKLPFPFHVFPILTGSFILLRPKSGARECNIS